MPEQTPEMTPERSEKLDALIERGFAEDHAGALAYAISQAESQTRDIEESPEDVRKIREGLAELDRGEGIVVTDLNAYFEDIKKRGRERHAAKLAESSV